LLEVKPNGELLNGVRICWRGISGMVDILNWNILLFSMAVKHLLPLIKLIF
jgi:hypothetical protein